MRLFIVLNERAEEKHHDVRYSLNRLIKQGHLVDSVIYPFLEHRDLGKSDTEICNEIYERAKSFQPDLILWSHIGNLHINEKLIGDLRKLNSKPSIGYRDGDIYQQFYKPLPKEVILLSKKCDVSFWPGYSKTIEILKTNGCNDIRYVPNTTDEKKFSLQRNGEIIKYDVVMVGNLAKSKIPFKTFPGTSYRQKLAHYFFKRLGNRFAAFGEGWKEPFAQGKIPFDYQNKIYHQSRIVLATNNLHADYYFSNRLPIILSSGVLVVHNYESGIDQVFKNLEYPYFYTNIEEAWRITADLLEKPQQELDAIAGEYRTYILNNLTMTNILLYMIEVLKDYKVRQNDNKELLRDNPWITQPQF